MDIASILPAYLSVCLLTVRRMKGGTSVSIGSEGRNVRRSNRPLITSVKPGQANPVKHVCIGQLPSPDTTDKRASRLVLLLPLLVASLMIGGTLLCRLAPTMSRATIPFRPALAGVRPWVPASRTSAGRLAVTCGCCHSSANRRLQRTTTQNLK